MGSETASDVVQFMDDFLFDSFTFRDIFQKYNGVPDSLPRTDDQSLIRHVPTYFFILCNLDRRQFWKPALDFYAAADRRSILDNNFLVGVKPSGQGCK